MKAKKAAKPTKKATTSPAKMDMMAQMGKKKC